MEIVYYPDMFIDSDETLKALILFWGKVRTVVPPSQKDYIDAYLAGEIKHETHHSLERYKQIHDLASESILDFLVISDEERERASSQMFDLVSNWNKDTGFYNSLKIESIDDLVGKWVEWYWFLHEKLERPLVELLLEEKLVVNWAPGEIVGYQEIGKSYLSIIADEIKTNRKIRLITDDEFCVAAKSGARLDRLPTKRRAEQEYQLVSMAIPQVFLNSQFLKKLSWKKVIKIRQELLPLAQNYYQELEAYQESINTLSAANQDDEAFEKFCEFCERVTISFKPFSKETGKILRLGTGPKAIGFLNGIILPTIKLVVPESGLTKICDIAAISSTVGQYALSKSRPLAGFEYLENLNRALRIESLKNLVTCLIPKKLKS